MYILVLHFLSLERLVEMTISWVALTGSEDIADVTCDEKALVV